MTRRQGVESLSTQMLVQDPLLELCQGLSTLDTIGAEAAAG